MKHCKTKLLPKAIRSLPALTFCFLLAMSCLARGEEAGLPAPARAVNSPGDITVLERPPWWAAQHTVWLLEGLAGVLFLSLVWGGLLRKQVRQGTRVLHEEIEERKRAEEALRESQVVYHSLVEHLPIIIYRKDSEGRFVFANSRYCEFKGVTAEQIIGKLREAEVLQGKGMSIEEILRQLGISDATYYKWRKEYGGLRVDQAKRLKELEQENSRLRKVVSDLSIDNAILKEAARGNW